MARSALITRTFEGRVFALMGYAIVEGRIDGDGLLPEIGRLNFVPRVATK